MNLRNIFSSPHSYSKTVSDDSGDALLQEPVEKVKQRKQSIGQNALLYIVICVLLVANGFQIYLSSSLRSRNATIPTPMCPPEFARQNLTLNRNLTWERLSDPASDALWNTGVPGITGWVQIENARNLNLPKGIPSLGKYEVYITTWGHQHHCLKILRKEFSKLLRGKSVLIKPHGNSSSELSADSTLHHLLHCFDYLRQTISCVSDLTLEGLNEHSNETNFDIDGYGVVHECKSQESVAAWLLSHAPIEEVYQNVDL